VVCESGSASFQALGDGIVGYYEIAGRRNLAKIAVALIADSRNIVCHTDHGE